jgi:hypothetical protein
MHGVMQQGRILDAIEAVLAGAKATSIEPSVGVWAAELIHRQNAAEAAKTLERCVQKSGDDQDMSSVVYCSALLAEVKPQLKEK